MSDDLTEFLVVVVLWAVLCPLIMLAACAVLYVASIALLYVLSYC